MIPLEKPGYSYSAYGLTIRSELHLSALTRGSSQPDVDVRRGKVDLPAEANDRPMYATPDDIYLSFNDVGRFRISRGSEIVIDAANVDDRIAELFVVGPALGALLHQRGLLVLHGSAVVVDDHAVAFLGHSGWGKSTMAAAMVKMGHSSFCDDLVPVTLCSGTPTALPGYPFLKLAQKSSEILGYGLPDWTPLLPDDNRCLIAAGQAHSGKSLPLARIYVLSEGDVLDIEPLKPQAAAVELIRHSYGSPWVKKSGMSAPHLQRCAALVRQLPILKLSRPRRLELLQEVAELVERDARKPLGD